MRISLKHASPLIPAALVAAGGLAASCSASSGGGVDRDSSEAAPTPTAVGGASSGGDMGMPPPGTPTSDPGGFMFDLGGEGGGGSMMEVPEECAKTSQAAEEIIVEIPVEKVVREPVALFIMMDRSGSMVTGFPPPASAQSWGVATSAVTAFVNDPQSQGINVGLGTFPVGQLNTAVCDGSDCGQPVVPIGALPGNAQPMIDGMALNAPSSDVALTPTECALNGMINHCAAYMAGSPTGEQCVAILVTDGTPTQCNGDQQVLVNIVANGLANGVMTYTLGLPGANLLQLDALAQAGGTGMSIDVTTGAQTFIDSLNSIRDSVTTTEIVTEIQSTQLDCSWLIPDPPEGETFDPAKVNIEFQADGVAPQGFGKVPDGVDCSQVDGGWYYEPPEANGSQKISVCESTCDIIKSSSNARVDIILGCETVEVPIR